MDGALVDPVPGNIGLLVDADTVVLLPFTEPAGVPPSDLAGGLTDLALASIVGPAPDSDVAWSSAAARRFATNTAYAAVDRDGASTLLTRDVSLQVLVALADLGGDPAEMGIYSRGLGEGAGAAEYRAFGVRVDADGDGGWAVVCEWQDLAGTPETITFPLPSEPTPGVVHLLTVTRRWESISSVVVRCYLGDRLLGEELSTVGEIGGGTAGTTIIGAWHSDPPGDFGSFLIGWIDQLKVVAREISPEEVRQTWARLARHQPDGVATVLGLCPPGAVWARAHGSDIGRLIKAAGQAVGFAAARTHELQAVALPSSAYRDTIGEWEDLVGLQRDGRLSLDARRRRVLARLQRDNGYAPPQVQEVLAPLFDVDPDDVHLVEFSPTVTDTFETLEVERWRAVPEAWWTIDSNALSLEAPPSADLRFDPASYLRHVHARTPIENDEGLIVQVKLDAYWDGNLPETAIVGLFLYQRRTNNAFWFGVKNDGGTRKLGWASLEDGVLGAFQPEVSPWTGEAVYLRIRRTGSDSLLLEWSETGFLVVGDSAVAYPVMAEGIDDVGMAAMATTSSLAAELVATFDDFLARTPASRRVFRWYAYRDPLLLGAPDMLAAHSLVQAIRPAHTEAAAVSSLSLRCDDDACVCDRTPLGAL